MNYDARKPLMAKIESLRNRRTLVCFMNFDRLCDPQLPGLSTNFDAQAKEALFRVLKESPTHGGVDFYVYTRGGDLNSVWPIVSLTREFDRNFNVLVPFRCHSSGTLLALGAEKIVMGSLSELSPIDPTTGNQFNPIDPGAPGSGRRLGISVEDVRAYRKFVIESLLGDPEGQPDPGLLLQFVQKLIDQVHPLALGNVERVLLQIEQLAANLLKLQPHRDRDHKHVVNALTSKFYSHLHMINRHEAKEILGKRVAFAPQRLADAMDALLRAYEMKFQLRRTFFLKKFLAERPEAEVRFIGGVLESRHWSYLYETKAVIRQRTKLPPNVQVQIPAGQALPLMAGLPRELEIDVLEQGWVRNEAPLGVTV